MSNTRGEQAGPMIERTRQQARKGDGKPNAANPRPYSGNYAPSVAQKSNPPPGPSFGRRLVNAAGTFADYEGRGMQVLGSGIRKVAQKMRR